MSEEKNGWVQSSIGNKIGTILWAVAGLIYLVISFMFFSVGAEGALGSLGVSWLITGILYIAVTVGMFLAKDMCSAFAKVWGVINLISAVILIVTAVVAVLCIIDFIKILTGKFNDKEKNPVTAWV